MARTLQSLGIRRAVVASGRIADGADAPWLDELSTLGVNKVAEFTENQWFARSPIELNHFSFQPASLGDLTGGDRVTNGRIVRAVLQGDERGPKRDAVLLNAAAALYVAGRAPSPGAGWDLAAELIDGGQAFAKLRELTST
jgi:anthranilate phosphoribosyltransferase